MTNETTKQQAIKRMARANSIMAEMATISPHYLAKVYRTCDKKLVELAKGMNVRPKYMTAEDKAEAIEKIRRYRYLQTQLETRDGIAKDLGVSRYYLDVWNREANGVIEAKEELLDSGAVRFLTMALPCSVYGQAGYY